MKIFRAFVTGTCLLAGLTSLVWGDVTVNNVSLEKIGNAVSVKIYGTQSFGYTHSSEPSHDGKPFRVWLDCSGCLNGFSQNTFHNLPIKTVSAIRTSQYADSPENIVRVVLDCTQPVTYTVKSQDNWVELTIPVTGESEFEKWFAVKTTSTPSSVAAVSKSMGTATVNKPVPATQSPLAAKPTGTSATSSGATAKPDTRTASTETKTSAQAQPTPQPTAQAKVSMLPTTASKDSKVTMPKTATPKPSKTEVGSVTTTTKQTTLPNTLPSVPQTSATSAEQSKTTSSTEATASSASKDGAPGSAAASENKMPLVLVQQPETAQEWGGYPQRQKVKYSPKARKDPFSPLFGKTDDFEFGVAPTPSIENLTLVGILESYNENYALLEDTRGYGYIMQAGDRVKEGRVLRVSSDQVIFQTTEYGWTRNVKLELYNQSK